MVPGPAFTEPVFGTPNCTRHTWEKEHKSGLGGQETGAPELAPPPRDDMTRPGELTLCGS